MRAIVNSGNADAGWSELPEESPIHLDEVTFGVIAESDALLVSHHYQREPRILQRFEPFRNAGHEFNQRGVVQEGNIADQRAIAIEKSQAPLAIGAEFRRGCM